MADRKEYFKQWRKDNPKRVKELNVVKNEVHKKRYATDPEFKQHWKRTIALQRYKITPAEYDIKLEEQGGHCALCETKEGVVAKIKHSLHVDHDHACCDGKIRNCGKCNRGILCIVCNNRLARLEVTLSEATVTPNPGTWTFKAILYLNHYKIKRAIAWQQPGVPWPPAPRTILGGYVKKVSEELGPVMDGTVKIHEFIRQIPRLEMHPSWSIIRTPGEIPETQEIQ